MSIFHDALKTYDMNENIVGVEFEGVQPLCPVSHIVQKAQIEITLNEGGKYIGGRSLERDEAETIIPATEKSAVRTNGTDPHPLCDRICYLADLPGSGEPEKPAKQPKDKKPDKKSKKQKEPEVKLTRYEAYLEKISDWAASDYSHPLVAAVRAYVAGGTILDDLEGDGVICRDADGLLTDGKINNIDYDSCLVRWRLEKEDGSVIQCWKDQELFRCFQEYYKNTYLSKSEQGLCMITGEYGPITHSYDKGLLPQENNAKILSCQDFTGFTWRGRMTNPDQVATIGYDACQKIHRALRWIIANNRVTVDKRTYVCWSPEGGKVMSPFANLKIEQDAPIESLKDYQYRVSDAIRGYSNDLPEDSSVIVAAFEASTKGRFSCVYYSNQSKHDFFERIQEWNENCCWKDPFLGMITPSLSRIVNCAYGVQRASKTATMIVAPDTLFDAGMQKMFSCVVEGRPIPTDIVQGLAHRANKLACYDKYNRNYLLTTTCAVLTRALNERAEYDKGGLYDMALQPDKMDRSYQYGRLLAWFERIERDTYGPGEKDREPMAIRLQTSFANRPLDISVPLRQSADVYLRKQHNTGLRAWYRKQLDGILAKIAEFPEEELNRPLDSTYLLGYALQRQAMYEKSKNTSEEEENIEGEEETNE